MGICRLKVNVIIKGHGFSLEFCVRSISTLEGYAYLPQEGFSLNFDQMLITVRWLAEHMSQLCRLKVNVKIKGHGV